MSLDPHRIQTIVADVLDQIERAGGDGAQPLGVHATLDEAVAAARRSFEAFREVPLETRARIIASIRAAMLAHLDTLATLAVEETGLGRVEDKIVKNRLVIEKTPGTEDIEASVWTGDHGLTLVERAPYGVIGVITPVTNPSDTIINNGISMIAGGNVAVFCPHPSARRISTFTIDQMNRAARRAGAPLPLLHSVAEPTIDVAKALLQHRGTRLNVVTGGPAVVKEAMASGKKSICAGPGNPPSVVDETADLEQAARDLVMGASLDNNIICVDEKEIVCVSIVADRLKELMSRSGAVILQPHQTEQLRKMVLEYEKGPRRHGGVNKKYVGKNVDVILRDAGIPCDASKRLAVCEVDGDHPFLWTELMMPILPLVRVRNADEGIDFAVEVEHGYRHTASMHSRNIDMLSKMARAMDCSIFVKNGPHASGLGWNGEGPTSFTIASPTGEGMTTARSFTRLRRCTLKDRFRIV
ncbi:MAG: aldehyde dehydrogenase EutE [Candidatus Eisenbacteria bacterium]|uniref:Aldehyde dehydrogenase EutE n=1 Tax=Eiseniibacteriota bacterium TaxID=2212470 RepID=A0A933SDE0_UNCEI|nr:aldehyde dehydrogenase EutE [Candidatus Eisenbacteria bacterium]